MKQVVSSTNGELTGDDLGGNRSNAPITPRTEPEVVNETKFVI